MSSNNVVVFVVTSLIYVVKADLVALGCDEGWENANQQCYMFINNKFVTWSQAEQECNQYDSSLMYFDNAAEIQWYTGFVPNYPSAAYWTSLNDNSWQGPNVPGTNVWRWGKYQRANYSLITWSSSPANDNQANCGGITVQGTMSDVGCNSTQGYICNVELNGGQCPDATWTQTPTDCYYVSNTSDISQLLTWDQARAKCASLGTGSHLLTIDDVNDQNFLTNALPFVTQSTYLYWTGLVYKSNTWQWFNGATFNQKFFAWAKEPDDLANKENCAVVRYNGYFSDRSCNIPQNYICKKGQDYRDTTLNSGCGIWTRAGKTCYEFYSGPPSTWSDAKAQCQRSQGDLMNVKDLDTMTWLQLQMLDPSNDLPFWTALNDRDVEGTYKWSDGSVLDPNVINWNSEPNDYKGQEDCAVLQPGRFGFNDISCQYKAAPICEISGVQSCPTKGGTWVSRGADSGTGLDCYLFVDYNNPTNTMTKPEALTYCQSLAGSGGQIPTLLCIETAAEKQFLQSQMAPYTNNTVGYWTSLTDAASEGYWSWDDNTDLDPTIVNWLQEPNNQTPNTDCALVIFNGYFLVKDCGEKHGFICERMSSLSWSSAGTSSSLEFTVLMTSVIATTVTLIRTVTGNLV